MTKSELIQRLAERNPHLYLRDVEKIVETVFEEITGALERGDRVELRVSVPFPLNTEMHAQGAIRAPAKRSLSKPKRLPFFKTGKALREALNEDGANDQSSHEQPSSSQDDDSDSGSSGNSWF